MVHGLATRRLQVLTNSFPVAEHLLKHSRVTVMLAGGTLYREQNIVLSPFEGRLREPLPRPAHVRRPRTASAGAA